MHIFIYQFLSWKTDCICYAGLQTSLLLKHTFIFSNQLYLLNVLNHLNPSRSPLSVSWGKHTSSFGSPWMNTAVQLLLQLTTRVKYGLQMTEGVTHPHYFLFYWRSQNAVHQSLWSKPKQVKCQSGRGKERHNKFSPCCNSCKSRTESDGSDEVSSLLISFNHFQDANKNFVDLIISQNGQKQNLRNVCVDPLTFFPGRRMSTAQFCKWNQWKALNCFFNRVSVLHFLRPSLCDTECNIIPVSWWQSSQGHSAFHVHPSSVKLFVTWWWNSSAAPLYY